MKQKTNKMLIFTSLAAYFTYFIHGIGASILGQYKPEFTAAWGAKPLADGTLDVSMVVSVIAALGLGRLISLPFSGPLSDKYGRKLSGIIGVLCYVAYFFGMANSTSMAMGYAFAVIGGIANSFLDTCVSPTCMEIYVNNPSVANLFTKFSICLSQFLLPFLIGIVASANMSYKTIFIVAGIAILIDGILILILPFPAREKKVQAKADKKKSGHKISPAAIAAILIGIVASANMSYKTIFIVAGIAILIDGILILILPFPAREKAVQAKADKKKSGHRISPAAIAAILIGFTSSSTFMLWLNCNQELARSYGMADPSKIQSLYALGTATAILATAAFIKKGLKEINVLILYPLISTIMLALCYFIQAPFICLVGGFVIGYAGAGGVLQLAVSTTAEFFPENKGTATSLVMIASSIANYTILSLAGYITKVGGSGAPRMILLLNMAVTIVGILLALFVKKNRNK